MKYAILVVALLSSSMSLCAARKNRNQEALISQSITLPSSPAIKESLQMTLSLAGFPSDKINNFLTLIENLHPSLADQTKSPFDVIHTIHSVLYKPEHAQFKPFLYASLFCENPLVMKKLYDEREITHNDFLYYQCNAAGNRYGKKAQLLWQTSDKTFSIDMQGEYEMPTRAEINQRLHNTGYRTFAEKTEIGKRLCSTFHTPESLSHEVNSLLEFYELKYPQTNTIPKKSIVMEILLAGHKGLLQELKTYKNGVLLE